jgi:hypothetical protein
MRGKIFEIMRSFGRRDDERSYFQNGIPDRGINEPEIMVTVSVSKFKVTRQARALRGSVRMLIQRYCFMRQSSAIINAPNTHHRFNNREKTSLCGFADDMVFAFKNRSIDDLCPRVRVYATRRYIRMQILNEL